MSSFIPSALFFAIPLCSLSLFYFHHPTQSTHSYFLIFSLSLLSILTGALGLALPANNSPALFAANLVFTALLRFELGVALLHLFNALVPSSLLSPFKLLFFNLSLAILLICATLTSLLAPFLSRSIPALLPPILTLFSNLLPIPFLSLLLLTHHCSSPSTPSSKPQEKLFQSTRDQPLTVYLRSVQNPDIESQTTHFDHKRNPKSLYISLLSSQISALLFSVIRITLHALSPPDAEENQNTELKSLLPILHVLQSIFIILWILCIIHAFFLYSFVSSLSPSFSPTPSCISKPCPCRPASSISGAYTLTHSSTSRHFSIHPQTTQPSAPTPSQLTEDFMSLRDPFASTNVGFIGRSSLLPLPSDLSQVPRDFNRRKVYPPSGRSLKSQTTPTSRKTKIKKRRSLGLLAPSISSSSASSVPPPPPPPSTPTYLTPFPTGGGCASTPTRESSSTSTLACSPEDADFDHEDAVLTQLLLINLDSQQSQEKKTETETARTWLSPSAELVGADGQGEDGGRLAPCTNRFTQDSTSTGGTLCESGELVAFKVCESTSDGVNE